LKELIGQVAVVTGASRGLGRRIALRLAHEGAEIALLARNEKSLEEVRREIEAGGTRALVVPVNLAEPESIDRVKDTIVTDLGIPFILVNAAGIFGPLSLIKDSDPSEWIRAIMVNTVGSYLTCRAFVGGMIDGGWGRIVNVTSAATLHKRGPANSAYATSKVALNQFTRHLASELSGTGVTANVIHPGDVKTDMWADIKTASERLGNTADAYTKWANWVQETGGDDPERAADLVLALMSDGAADTNGRFLWIKDCLQSPLPSWGDHGELQPWQK